MIHIVSKVLVMLKLFGQAKISVEHSRYLIFPGCLNAFCVFAWWQLVLAVTRNLLIVCGWALSWSSRGWSKYYTWSQMTTMNIENWIFLLLNAFNSKVTSCTSSVFKLQLQSCKVSLLKSCRLPFLTPAIVKGNNSLNLVWFKWGSQWWGILKYFPQNRCILISHWSREKRQSSIII